MIGERAFVGALASVVVLSLWLGAAVIVAAVVAPAAFAVLPSRGLAGALVGRVLPVLFWSGVLVGVVAAVLARGATQSRPRLLAAVAMILACAAAQVVVAPRIERVRRDAVVPIDQLAPDDARRAAFGRLHGASVALLGVASLAGAAALLFTVRALHLANVDERLSHLPHEF